MQARAFVHYVCGTEAVIKKLNHTSLTFFHDFQGRNAIYIYSFAMRYTSIPL